MPSFALGVNLFGLTEPFTRNKKEALRQLKEIGFDCIEPMLIVMQRDPDILEALRIGVQKVRAMV